MVFRAILVLLGFISFVVIIVIPWIIGIGDIIDKMNKRKWKL